MLLNLNTFLIVPFFFFQVSVFLHLYSRSDMREIRSFLHGKFFLASWKYNNTFKNKTEIGDCEEFRFVKHCQ